VLKLADVDRELVVVVGGFSVATIAAFCFSE
jgi:hypothetical protein